MSRTPNYTKQVPALPLLIQLAAELQCMANGQKTISGGGQVQYSTKLNWQFRVVLHNIMMAGHGIIPLLSLILLDMEQQSIIVAHFGESCNTCRIMCLSKSSINS